MNADRRPVCVPCGVDLSNTDIRIHIYIRAGPAKTPSIQEVGHAAPNFTHLDIKFRHGVFHGPTETCRAGSFFREREI